VYCGVTFWPSMVTVTGTMVFGKGGRRFPVHATWVSLAFAVANSRITSPTLAGVHAALMQPF
jgi:hypothetical protein